MKFYGKDFDQVMLAKRHEVQITKIGCPAYTHASDDKLEPREKMCIFLDYARGVKSC